MSKKITMLKVWYYPHEGAHLSGNKRKTLIRPEEFDDFRKNVYSLLKVKRMRIKIN